MLEGGGRPRPACSALSQCSWSRFQGLFDVQEELVIQMTSLVERSLPATI